MAERKEEHGRKEKLPRGRKRKNYVYPMAVANNSINSTEGLSNESRLTEGGCTYSFECFSFLPSPPSLPPTPPLSFLCTVCRIKKRNVQVKITRYLVCHSTTMYIR